MGGNLPAEVTKLFPLGDAKLQAIRWLHTGIAMDMDVPDTGFVQLYFDWATEVKIDLNFHDLAEGLLW